MSISAKTNIAAVFSCVLCLSVGILAGFIFNNFFAFACGFLVSLFMLLYIMVVVSEDSVGNLANLSIRALKNKENTFTIKPFLCNENDVLLRVENRHKEIFYAFVDKSRIRGGTYSIPPEGVPFRIVKGKNLDDLVIIKLGENEIIPETPEIKCCAK